MAQIRTGGRHLLALVSEVLDVSRIESGTLTVSLEPVVVADAVDEAVDLVRNQAAAAGVTVRRTRAPVRRDVTCSPTASGWCRCSSTC